MQSTANSGETTDAIPWLAIGVLFVVYWAIFYGAYLIQDPVHNFIGSFTELRSEYMVLEQLSSFYCITIIFSAVLVYGLADDKKRLRLAIAILILGVLLHFSESNFLRKGTQMVCGAVAFPAVLLCLFLGRAFLPLVFLSVGLIAAVLGYGIDLVADEPEFVARFLPGLSDPVKRLAEAVSEESAEAFGIAWMCLAVLICFLPELTRFIREHCAAAVILVASFALIAVAHGFLHWSYRRSTAKELFALIPAFLSFAGLVWANRRIAYPYRLRIFSEQLLYFLFYVFFIMLPTYFDKTHTLTDILLWLPAMVFSAVYLYIHRDRQARPVTDTG